MSDSGFEIDGSWINGEDVIESRLASVDEDSKDEVRLVLRYLFVTGGPISIGRTIKARVEQHLSPVERFVLQWLHKRTDGKLRRHYGPKVLDTIKKARYQCERCGFRDVRALNLEKDESEDPGDPEFVCLCANCNTVAARAKEMAVVALDKEIAAKAAAEAALAAEEQATEESSEEQATEEARVEADAGANVSASEVE